VSFTIERRHAMSDQLLVRGRWIITGGAESDPLLSDAAVLVTGDQIQGIGPWQDLRARHPDAEVIGSDRVAVIPGLINAHHHSHGVSTLQQGVADQVLESWILALARSRPTDIYLDTLLSSARLLQSGVTSVVDMRGGRGTAEQYAGNVRRALQAYDEAGLRVAFAAGLSDQSYLVAGKGADEKFLATLPADVRAHAQALLPTANDLREDDYFAVMDDIWRETRDHPRIDLWFGPPGPQWVSDRFMQRIAERAEAYDVGIQTHVTESIYEKLHGPRFYGKDTLAHLRDLGVLGPRFSIAHGVWLTEAEIGILAETGAAVSHNPSSNLRLRAGIAPLNALLEAGATVGLGMDGTSINDDEDMFAEMRLALRLNRTPLLGGPAPSVAQIFEMATSGGAKLLRKETTLGRLAPGYAADLVLVDLERITWPWVAPEADPRDLLVQRAWAGDVDTVLIAGEVVLRDGRPTRFDPAEAGRELAARLAVETYPDAAARMVEALLPRVETYYRGWEMPELEPYSVTNSKR
jgi:cytosine/adenosine deaminase-related metal-dependent hydrolase